MVDVDRWERLAFHLHDVCTLDDENVTRAERAAVDRFARIHARLDDPEV